MKKFCLVLLVASLWLAVNVRAENPGGKVFESLGCGVCHKSEASETFPSLKQMTQAYQAKANQLIKYLNGEAEPIMRPEKASRMKRYIEKTKALSDADRQALVDFIMSHK
jgi:cytochrome c551/c552